MGYGWHNWLLNDALDAEFQRVIPLYVRGRLIDIGCGTKPYREMLAPYVTEHVGVDHESTQHARHAVDVFAPAHALPFADATFDSAFCTSLIEHVPDPALAVRECARVLRPGGHAIYSTPFTWHVHEAPYDFFRFTHYGLRQLMENAGLEVLSMTWANRFWGTLAQMLAYQTTRFNFGLVGRTQLPRAAAWAVQSAGKWMDRLDPRDELVTTLVAVGRKRGG